MDAQEMRLRTRAVHAGRADLRARGVHAPPLDLSTTYPLEDLDEEVATLDRWSEGARRAGNPIYTRVFNETVARFEDAIADLEGTSDAVAFASGMAAFAAVLLAVRNDQTDHIVAIRPLYGTTDHVLAARLFGLDVTWTTPNGVAKAIRPGTAAVVLETPQNPTLELVDIAAVVAQADPVPILVDNTFATPVLQNPARQGATFVLHSATKFIGGHGDVAGGVVATTSEWAAALRRVRFATGGLLHPFAAYLLHRGLPTLPLRVEAAQETAQELVRRLRQHPAIERVLYPSHDLWARCILGTQMRGPGALLAIDLGDEARAKRLLSGLRLALHAVSLGSFDTLVEHPASMTHRIVDNEARARHGISSGLVRISVGLEHADDLWADLTRALDEEKKAKPAARKRAMC